MAQIYVSDKTKELLEKVSEADRRTQDGEILYLLDRRDREMEAGMDKLEDRQA
jgi:hypothetical protein